MLQFSHIISISTVFLAALLYISVFRKEGNVTSVTLFSFHGPSFADLDLGGLYTVHKNGHGHCKLTSWFMGICFEAYCDSSHWQSGFFFFFPFLNLK